MKIIRKNSVVIAAFLLIFSMVTTIGATGAVYAEGVNTGGNSTGYDGVNDNGEAGEDSSETNYEDGEGNGAWNGEIVDGGEKATVVKEEPKPVKVTVVKKVVQEKKTTPEEEVVPEKEPEQKENLEASIDADKVDGNKEVNLDNEVVDDASAKTSGDNTVGMDDNFKIAAMLFISISLVVCFAFVRMSNKRVTARSNVPAVKKSNRKSSKAKAVATSRRSASTKSKASKAVKSTRKNTKK